MDKAILRKALIVGIPAGIISALLVVGIRTASAGGSYLEHLTSYFGILLLIILPITWVCHTYRQEKQKKEQGGEKE